MQTYNEPDLNAPRYFVEEYNPFTRKFFKEFKDKYPELKDLNETQIRKTIKTSNRAIFNKVLEKRDGVELPKSLGHLIIGTCKKLISKNLDNKLSKLYKIPINHRNFESDEHVQKIFYTNYASKYKFKNNQLWEFFACREFTRASSANYRINWKKYIMVENTFEIHELFKEQKHYEYKKQLIEAQLENYNEFEGF